MKFKLLLGSLFMFTQKSTVCNEIAYADAVVAKVKNVTDPTPTLVKGLVEKSFIEGVKYAADIGSKGVAQLRTLRYACVITRHGSRSPTTTYKSDPYPYTDLKYWPDGPGQLTRYGKQQLFTTGKSLRKRYTGFINENYFHNETLVRSNFYDRDFMSAACLLAGLYPPTGYQLWNPSILWQPIPIWDEPFDVADVASDPKVCPTYIREQTKAQKEFNRISPKYKKLLNYLSKHTHQNITEITGALYLYDTLQLQAENGYKLPTWTKKVYPGRLAEFYAGSLKAAIAGTPEMIRLAAGPIFKMIDTQLVTKAKGTMKPNRIIYIEAGHDVTLVALLAGLGYTNAFLIETSAYMVFELHEGNEGYVVQFLYFNSSITVEPTKLDAPKCRTPCNLRDFSKLTKEIAPENWKEECGLYSDSD